MLSRRFIRTMIVGLLLAIAGCGINSVTKAQLQAVKPGDILVYRFQKDGKSWFYADKITRIEGDKVYYNPGKHESTSGKDDRIKDFDSDRQLSITRDELLKYENEQGDDRKVIIWIL